MQSPRRAAAALLDGRKLKTFPSSAILFLSYDYESLCSKHNGGTKATALAAWLNGVAEASLICDEIHRANKSSPPTKMGAAVRHGEARPLAVFSK